MRFQRAAQPLKLDGPDAAYEFFAGCFAESDPARECLWVAHVDRQANCIGLSRYYGDGYSTSFPVRAIIAEMITNGSSGIVLAHNHPSGNPRPSHSDCIATRKLASAAQAIDCTILDHLVFGGNGFASFRNLGLL